MCGIQLSGVSGWPQSASSTLQQRYLQHQIPLIMTWSGSMNVWVMGWQASYPHDNGEKWLKKLIIETDFSKVMVNLQCDKEAICKLSLLWNVVYCWELLE